MIPRRLAALGLSLAAAGSAAATVDAARWHDRLLIVFARDAADPSLAEQQRIAAAAAADFAARDLRLVAVVGNAVRGAADDAAALRRRYRVATGAFRAVLVGKDGGVKLTSPRPLAADRLAATIDAMPMRRAEMRR